MNLFQMIQFVFALGKSGRKSRREKKKSNGIS